MGQGGDLIAEHPVALAPVSGKDRIAVLDILRGIAILGIFFMNIPWMSGPTWASMEDFREMGWSLADQNVWLFLETTWEGTQRGMLEFLFGAGLMVTAAKVMEPDGPVGVADLYIRRNLWLLAFGLFDIFVLLWPGDILHTYALCALALFPFRKLAVRWLLSIGLAFAMLGVIFGGAEYLERSNAQATYQIAAEKQAKAQSLSAAETEAVKEWKEIEKRVADTDPEMEKLIKEEARLRAGGMSDYAAFQWSAYTEIVSMGGLLFGVVEAFSAMLIGIALWKLGFIQGKCSTREYLLAMLLAYGFGMGARYIGGLEQMSFQPIPKTIWMTNELARLAVSLGHVALVNLAVKSLAGRNILAPFKAAGQMAFTLYFMEQIIGTWVMFSPIGLDLPGKQGWAHLALQAAVVCAGLLVFANVWMRYFAAGPLEWLWRSLAYCRWQAFRKNSSVESQPVRN